MRKLLFILFFVFSFVISLGQPITQRSSTAITVQDGNLFAQNSFRPAVFSDTTAGTIGLDSCGKLIYTYSDNSYWLRACSPKRWIKLLKTGEGGTLNTNLGSSFRWLNEGTQAIKTVANSWSVLWDSTSTANTLTAKADTARSTGLPTYHYVDSLLKIGYIVDWIDTTNSGSEFSTWTNANLVGKTILEVQAYPYNLQPVNSSPASDQVQINTITGVATFGTPIQNGQSVRIVYKYLAANSAVDGSETKITQGAGIVVTGSGTTGSPYEVASVFGGNGLLTGDSTYALLAGVLRPEYDTTTNTNRWYWINDNGHSNINFIDSILVLSSEIHVYYNQAYSKVSTFLIVPDESVSQIVRTTANFQGVAGSVRYTNGPYFAGARVFVDSAIIQFSAMKSLSFRLSYNGTAWSWTNTPGNLNAINISSPAPKVTWTNGVLDVDSLTFNARQFPNVGMYRFNGTVDSLLAYHPSINLINNRRVICNFWDIRNNVKLTAATPPTNFGVFFDFGQTAAFVNPITEDFGEASNWWVIAIMKADNSP